MEDSTIPGPRSVVVLYYVDELALSRTSEVFRRHLTVSLSLPQSLGGTHARAVHLRLSRMGEDNF